MICPPWYPTVHPAWVHTALNAARLPSSWRMTMSGLPSPGSGYVAPWPLPSRLEGPSYSAFAGPVRPGGCYGAGAGARAGGADFGADPSVFAAAL
jgi:hypothetical protein